MSKVYFVATRHPDYQQFARDQHYPEGAVIIDPWRYIPDQPGVTVKRLGQNRPTLISLLMPSRGRPQMMRRTVLSCFETATYPRSVEALVYVDDDDPRRDEYENWYRKPDDPPAPENLFVGVGPRILLSEAWNELARTAHGEIFMHAGDDLVFKTPGWDQQVRQAFAASEDKILLVQGDDLSPNREALATHGFLHRRWVETVGYFLPPLFSCDWNDVWLTEVADMLDRRVRLPFVTEHQHYTFEKRPRDKTDEEREQRGRDDNVVELFKNTADERKADAAKLRAVMG